MGAPSVAQVKTAPDKKEKFHLEIISWTDDHVLYIYFSLCESCVLKIKILKFKGYLKTNSEVF